MIRREEGSRAGENVRIPVHEAGMAKVVFLGRKDGRVGVHRRIYAGIVGALERRLLGAGGELAASERSGRWSVVGGVGMIRAGRAQACAAVALL